MQTGVVKFYNESKGYGFIKNEETGNDIFVHATGIVSGTIKQDDRVSYVEEDGKKGKFAAQVVVIEE